MSGVCGIVVLAAAAGAFWISPYNQYTLHDFSTFATHVRDVALNTLPRPAPPLAPAAQLARAPGPAASQLRIQPQPPGPQSVEGGDDMAEFLRLGGQMAPLPPAAAPRAPKPAPETRMHAVPLKPTPTPQTTMAPAPPRPDHLAPRVAATIKPRLSTEPAMVTSKPTLPAGAVSRDAVAQIVELRPAPMTDQQQLQVLQLVTELGILVRDQRSEIAQLRQDQQSLGSRVDGSLTDFGRRLSLAEARGAVSAAMSVQTPPPAGTVASTRSLPAAPATSVIRAASMPAAAPVDLTPHRYHVQAASPGLAMLSALDSSGGEEQQLPVSPGDNVPGYGKVVSISQRGATWVVKTDRGLIQ
ncbi:hypothetical protein [Acidisoma sp. L85]|uniref:hypothetical protein n=1 Tax=Acidisoma sp. L85 TaxID=1641850 RepID=UPI00131E5217|nr:hypothetical protein [Acidisoma sp. L85]